MNRIYKYPVGIVDQQTIKMPRGHRILTAQLQGGAVCIWVEVDSTAPLEDTIIEVFGTGNPIEDTEADRTYIASVQQGVFVWHIYERHH